jgi:hypothetical protein
MSKGDASRKPLAFAALHRQRQEFIETGRFETDVSEHNQYRYDL